MDEGFSELIEAPNTKYRYENLIPLLQDPDLDYVYPEASDAQDTNFYNHMVLYIFEIVRATFANVQNMFLNKRT